MPGWDEADPEDQDIQKKWSNRLQKVRQNPIKYKELIIDPKKAGIDPDALKESPLRIRGIEG